MVPVDQNSQILALGCACRSCCPVLRLPPSERSRPNVPPNPETGYKAKQELESVEAVQRFKQQLESWLWQVWPTSPLRPVLGPGTQC